MIDNNKLEDIEGFEGKYQINRKGQIYSCKSNKFLKQHKHRNGYTYLKLSKNGWTYTVMAHREMAKKWIPNPNNYPYVIHIDGDNSNNRLGNLKWVPTIPPQRRKLSDQNIKAIKLLYETGLYTQTHLAKTYNVSRTVIYNAIQNTYNIS